MRSSSMRITGLLTTVILFTACGGAEGGPFAVDDAGSTTSVAATAAATTTVAPSTIEAPWTLTATRGVLAVGIPSAEWPYFFESDSGDALGIWPDMIREFSDPLGLTVDWVVADGDAAMYSDLAAGAIDVALPVEAVPEAVAARYGTTIPYSRAMAYVLYNPANSPGLTLEDIGEGTIGFAWEGSVQYWWTTVEPHFQDAWIATVTGFDDSLFQLIAEYTYPSDEVVYPIGVLVAHESGKDSAIAAYPSLAYFEEAIEAYDKKLVVDPATPLVAALNDYLIGLPEGFYQDLVGFWIETAPPEEPGSETTVTTAESDGETTVTTAGTDATVAPTTPPTINRSGFGTAVAWSGGPVGCERGCYFADVTGDGLVDFIAHDNDGLYVGASLGSTFDLAVPWISGDVGCHVNCYFEDVTGDGAADFIAHDNDAMYVLPSTGSGFGAAVPWSGGPVGCERGCYFADVTGDGLVDFIAHDNDGLYVGASLGSTFDLAVPWISGDVGCHVNCYFEDVTGDGAADFIAHDNDAMYVLAAI